MAQGISQPDTEWRQSIGGMAQLIFDTEVDFNAGQSSFDASRQIDADIVKNAVESYTRLLRDIENSAQRKSDVERLREEGRITIQFNEMTLEALRALEEFLRAHDLKVNLFDPLNAASALEGVEGATAKVKYGLFVLAQLTLEIS